MKKIRSLSVIIPCYNEEHTIESVLDEVEAVDLGPIKKEIIVIDDYSTDGTRVILQKIAKQHPRIQVLLQDRNRGKGTALRRGFEASHGDLVIVQDADREYDPRDYTKLLALFLNDRADIVFGSRFSGGAPRRIAYLANTIGNKVMTRMSALLSGLYVTDIHTCYIMFKGDWIRDL